MAETSLYERVLEQISEGSELPPPKPPRASASIVPWRRRGGSLEVFWLRRADTMAFMGGWFAFPGGGVTRADRRLELSGRPRGIEGAPPGAALPEAVIDGVGELGPILAPGVLAAAFRELFEETGLLPARGEVSPSGLAQARAALLEKELDFGDFLRGEGLELDVGGLEYAGRWLTPPLGPIRFDNRFFFIEWPEERPLQPEASSRESSLGEWIEPRHGLDRWRRGEVITAPPILHILQVLKEEGLDGRRRLVEPAERNLGPHRLVEFRPGVLVFPVKTPTLPPASYTNAYVLGTRECVLVDPGSPDPVEIDRLAAALGELERIHGRRVTAIWLTHHHPDHVGGAEALRRALGVPLLAHPEAAQRLAGRGLEVDDELRDGQSVELKGNPPFPLRVLYTPGHARGHLAFLDEQFGSLVCGDVVAGSGTIVIDPPEGDMDVYLETLQRLEELAPRTLFPAHGPTVLDARGKLRAYRKHRLWREERILEAWLEGRREPARILPLVYPEVPAVARPLAERQIVAHLERLERRGALG